MHSYQWPHVLNCYLFKVDAFVVENIKLTVNLRETYTCVSLTSGRDSRLITWEIVIVHSAIDGKYDSEAWLLLLIMFWYGTSVCFLILEAKVFIKYCYY